jgi:hypothetical protein
VKVTDADGRPVGTAVLQHPEEDVRHEVSIVDGSWVGSKIYTRAGDEIAFQPGYVLKLAVSAPGYRSTDVEVTLRKKKNVVVVALAELPATSTDPQSDPSIGFDHDDPIDGAAP